MYTGNRQFQGGIAVHLDYFSSFCMVVKKKSITKAAAELHISQPALSLQVNCLESRFGVKLLNRTNKGVELTPAGEVLYNHCQRLITIMEAIKRDMDELHHGRGKALKMAATFTLGSYVVPVIMFSLRQDFPHYQVNLSIKFASEIIGGLLDRTTDIGLVTGPLSPADAKRLEENNISQREIGRDEVIAVAVPGSRWTLNTLNLSRTKAPLLLPAPGCGVRNAIQAALKSEGADIQKLNQEASFENSMAIITAALTGRGVGLVPKIVAAKKLDSGTLQEIPISIDIPLPFNLLFSPGLAEEFVPKIMEYCENLS